jgi:hypothetical protein
MAGTCLKKYKVEIDGETIIVQKSGKCCWFDASGEKIEDATLLEQIQEAIKSGNGKEVPVGSYLCCTDCEEDGGSGEETPCSVAEYVTGVRIETDEEGVTVKVTTHNNETGQDTTEEMRIGGEGMAGLLSAEDKTKYDGYETTLQNVVNQLNTQQAILQDHGEMLSATSGAIANILEVLSEIMSNGVPGQGVTGTCEIPTYVHVQTSPTTEWNIEHEFGTEDMLEVFVKDEDGDKVIADEDYVSSTANMLVLRFGVPSAGTATVKHLTLSCEGSGGNGGGTGTGGGLTQAEVEQIVQDALDGLTFDSRIGALENNASATTGAIATLGQQLMSLNEATMKKAIFNDSHDALVSDMILAPSAGELALITKILKNVSSGSVYPINIHVTSVDGSIEAEISQQDDHNYTLDLSTAGVDLSGLVPRDLVGTTNKIVQDITYDINPTTLKIVWEKKLVSLYDGERETYNGEIDLGGLLGALLSAKADASALQALSDSIAASLGLKADATTVAAVQAALAGKADSADMATLTAALDALNTELVNTNAALGSANTAIGDVSASVSQLSMELGDTNTALASANTAIGQMNDILTAWGNIIFGNSGNNDGKNQDGTNSLTGVVTEHGQRITALENDTVKQSIFSNTNDALVADMAIEPAANMLAKIIKTLKNAGGNSPDYVINVKVTSSDGSLVSTFSQEDDHNYVLDLRVA